MQTPANPLETIHRVIQVLIVIREMMGLRGRWEGKKIVGRDRDISTIMTMTMGRVIVDPEMGVERERARVL